MNKCKKCGKEHEYKSRYYMCDLDNQRKEELNQLYKESENDFNEQYIINNDDSNRSTGRTTRLIDYYIQKLFNNPNKEIEIIDHYDNIKAHIYLTQKMLERLYTEHPRVKFNIVNQNTLKYER